MAVGLELLRLEHAKLLVLLSHHLNALEIHLLLALLSNVPLVLLKVCDLLQLNWLVRHDGLLRAWLGDLVDLSDLREVVQEQLLLGHVVLVQHVWIIDVGVLDADWRLLNVVLQIHELVVPLGLSLVEADQVLAMAKLLLGDSVHRLVSLVDADELLLDKVVVRHVRVLKLVQVVEDVSHFNDILGLVP